MPTPIPIGFSIVLVLMLFWGLFCALAPQRAARVVERLQGPILTQSQRKLAHNVTFVRGIGACQVVACVVFLVVGNRH